MVAGKVGSKWIDSSMATDEELENLKNSPALIGTPTSTTPPEGDNSQRIATTEYVLSAISANTVYSNVDGGSPSSNFGGMIKNVDGGTP